MAWREDRLAGLAQLQGVGGSAQCAQIFGRSTASSIQGMYRDITTQMQPLRAQEKVRLRISEAQRVRQARRCIW